MNRLFSLVVVLAVLVSLSACGDKKPPMQSAIKGNAVVHTLQDLSHMFEKKSLSGFMNLVSDRYKNRQTFSASLSSVFAKYEAVRFSIQYTKMLITIDEKGTPKAAFNWDSEWQTEGGRVQKNSGRITFVFDPRDSKLVTIDGKNPFIPQPVELPGK